MKVEKMNLVISLWQMVIQRRVRLSRLHQVALESRAITLLMQLIFRSRLHKELSQEKVDNFLDTRSIHGLQRLVSQHQVWVLFHHHLTTIFTRLRILHSSFTISRMQIRMLVFTSNLLQKWALEQLLPVSLRHMLMSF